MEPIWRLDRRDSGHLFWRRDSSSPAAPDRARVKFRCDVEVLEFWPREDDPSSDDCGDDDEEEERRLKEWRRRRSAPVAASNPAVVVAICLAAVVVTVSLPWLLVR